MSESITSLSVDSLHESPFNPRQTYDEASLRSLAEDIKSHGRVLQPLQVRPRVPPLFKRHMDIEPDPAAITGYEIVFGHRRFRAAKLAGLDTVPCMIRMMSDEEAAKQQISENLGREDVTALEEAQGFRKLIDEHNMTADMLAEQFGQSRSYVYGRLKLLNLCHEVRKAVIAKEIDAEVGLLIARVGGDKLQAKALGYIRGKYLDLTDGGKRSYRGIKDLLNERFTLDLKVALFDIEAEMLVPSAGNCVTCPKRTGNAPEFADVAAERKDGSWSRKHVGADVCTDPDCFDEKKKAHLKLKAAELQAKGKTVIDGNRARQLVDAQGNVKNGFVALKGVKDELAKARLAAQRDSKIVPPLIVTIQNPRDGKTFEAIKVDELKAAGVKVKEPKPAKRAYDWEEENRKRQEAYKAESVKAEAERAARMAIMRSIREAVGRTERTAFDLQIVARAAFRGVDHNGKQILPELWGHKSVDALSKAIGQMSVADITLFLLDCGLVADVAVGTHDYKSPANDLLQAARHYGIDATKVRAEVTGGASTPPPAARAPTKAAKGKAAAKAKKRPLKVADAGAPLEPELNQDQTDDAGFAGGSHGQVDAFADVELEA